MQHSIFLHATLPMHHCAHAPPFLPQATRTHLQRKPQPRHVLLLRQVVVRQQRQRLADRLAQPRDGAALLGAAGCGGALYVSAVCCYGGGGRGPQAARAVGDLDAQVLFGGRMPVVAVGTMGTGASCGAAVVGTNVRGAALELLQVPTNDNFGGRQERRPACSCCEPAQQPNIHPPTTHPELAAGGPDGLRRLLRQVGPGGGQGENGGAQGLHRGRGQRRITRARNEVAHGLLEGGNEVWGLIHVHDGGVSVICAESSLFESEKHLIWEALWHM